MSEFTVFTTAPASSKGSAATTRRRGRRSFGSRITCGGSTTRARLLYMDIPHSVESLREATHDLVRANGLPRLHPADRVLRLRAARRLTQGNPVETVIMNWPWGAYLGEDALAKGITAKISSWTRIGPNVIPHAAKATGVYLNSMLATTEARRGGYDEAIMLTDQGTSPTGRARTSSSSRTAGSSRRRCQPRSSPGSPGRR